MLAAKVAIVAGAGKETHVAEEAGVGTPQNAGMQSSPITEVTIALHSKEEEVEDRVRHRHLHRQVVDQVVAGTQNQVTGSCNLTATTSAVARDSTASSRREPVGAISVPNRAVHSLFGTTPSQFVTRLPAVRPSSRPLAEDDEEMCTLRCCLAKLMRQGPCNPTSIPTAKVSVILSRDQQEADGEADDDAAHRGQQEADEEADDDAARGHKVADEEADDDAAQADAEDADAKRSG